MKKHIVIILTIFMFVSILAILPRGRYSNLVIGNNNFSDFIIEQTHDEIYSSNENEFLSSLYASLDKAELIVKATYLGERVPVYQSTLSKIRINYVYKGNQDLLNKDIAMYEYNFFSGYQNEGIFRNFNISNLMSAGKEYYIFLSEKKMTRRDIYGLQEYVPSGTVEQISILPVKFNSESIAIINKDDIKSKRIFFKQVENSSYIVTDNLAAEQINSIYQNLVRRYNLE